VFRLATDAEEFGQQARELAHELDDTKRELLDKTTEALIVRPTPLLYPVAFRFSPSLPKAILSLTPAHIQSFDLYANIPFL
jgi:hypothetical protein